MDLNYIRRLVKLVTESGIVELEIEQDNTRVRITQAAAAPQVLQYAAPAAAPVATTAPAPAAAPDTPREGAHVPAHAQHVGDSAYEKILSPIVGTFYRSPSPEADPFVQVGQTISPGDTLCIIEAMKIMNEIEAEVSGRIVRALVENGQAVEYNQPLFLVEPA
jgi:acetyl-CoA carboxylase biotin carboxyl carrier protein